MSEKFKKIDKEFCITDNSLNVYKYRCLTEGLQLDEVKKNPIGFLMHKRENGVVVRWEDFRTENDQVFAKPVVNLSHPEGQSIADQIENGFLNAASVGKIVCLEATNDPNLKLEGQTGPTVTKWFPREISLVDIPGNYNALANLYDENDNELNLADFNNDNTDNTMSKNALNVAVILTALNLSDQAQEGEVLGVIQDLIDKADKVPILEKDLKDKEKELDSLKQEGVKKEVTNLIAQGKESKKLTEEMANKLSEKYATDPEGLKDLIDTMPTQISVVETINTPDLGDWENKDWDSLYREGKLGELKEKYPELYDKKKNERFPNLKQD